MGSLAPLAPVAARCPVVPVMGAARWGVLARCARSLCPAAGGLVPFVGARAGGMAPRGGRMPCVPAVPGQ